MLNYLKQSTLKCIYIISFVCKICEVFSSFSISYIVFHCAERHTYTVQQYLDCIVGIKLIPLNLGCYSLEVICWSLCVLVSHLYQWNFMIVPLCVGIDFVPRKHQIKKLFTLIILFLLLKSTKLRLNHIGGHVSEFLIINSLNLVIYMHHGRFISFTWCLMPDANSNSC